MQCRACGANADLPGGPPLCPACLAVTGGELATGSKVSSSALWLWTSAPARQALATGDLGVIIKAWRTATGTNQRTLAEDIGYDPTYISMIETGAATSSMSTAAAGSPNTSAYHRASSA